MLDSSALTDDVEHFTHLVGAAESLHRFSQHRYILAYGDYASCSPPRKIHQNRMKKEGYERSFTAYQT